MIPTRTSAPWLLLVMLLVHALTLRAAPALQAEIDRSQITADDTVTLTLRLNDSGNHTPDFSALQKDFSIVGESSGSVMSATMGHIETWNEWHVTLAPLHTGTLTIPSFTIAGAQSRPLRVLVQPAAQAGPSQRNPAADADTDTGEERPAFIEASIDQPSVYVQQQLILTVRVYQSVPLDDMHITDPEFDNATVRKLGQNKSQREVRGVSYQVHELSYAIFPQQAGELTIPELVFTASEIRRPRSLFDIGGRGHAIRAMSRQLSVKVKPIPPQFSGKVWLPARNLTLQETWGGNPETIHAGDSITRSIAVQADGVLASQLPAVVLPQLAQGRLYADQPALDDQADASGVHGVRTDSAALIPSQAGPLTLPEVRIAWWDLGSDSEKVATIPAQTLTILPSTATPVTPPAPAEPAAQPHPEAPAAMPSSAPLWATLPWMGIAALFALLWLVTLVLFWRARRRWARTPLAQPPQGPTPKSDSWGALLAACRRDDAAATAAALDRWLRATHPSTPTAEQWLRTLPAGDDTDALRAAIAQLQRALYRDDSKPWRGAELARSLQRSSERSTAGNTQTALPALYPA